MEGGVTFWIYDDKGREVTSIGAEIKGNKAEAEWTYHWKGEKLDAKPKYTFEVTGNRCKKVESGDVEIGAKIEIYLKKSDNTIIKNKNYILYKENEEFKKGKFDSDGKVEEKDVVPGKYSILIKTKDE